VTLDALVKSRKPDVHNLLAPIRKVLPSPFQDATNVADLVVVSLLIIDDFSIRKLPHIAAEDLRELVMRRFKRATPLTSNTPGLRIGRNFSADNRRGHGASRPPLSQREKLHQSLRPHRVSFKIRLN
jgi:hypothetical protein